MKKTLTCLLVGLLTLTAITACGGGQSDTDSAQSTTKDTAGAVTTPAATTTATPPNEGNAPETSEHVHGEGVAWTVDRDSHWKICICGSTVEMGDHILEDDVCTVCGVEYYEWGDATASLYQYNAAGDCVLSVDYDENGTVVFTVVSEYVYSEDGDLQANNSMFYDGEASMENAIYAEQTLYNADGNVTESTTTYLINGVVDSTEKCDFVYDEYDNLLTETRNYYDKAGDLQSTDKTEYTYDADGEPLTEKSYTDGKLTYEYEYTDGGFVGITYNEDGTKTVLEYDEGDDEPKETWYDADGNLLDLSYLFDKDAAKDLIGSWTTTLDVKDLFLGEADIPKIDLPCNMTVNFTFRNDGTCHLAVEFDEEEYKAFMIEMIYVSGEAEGVSRPVMDAVFQQQSGMTIAEYVDLYITEGISTMDGLNKDGVYYVADGMLYVGDNWNNPLEGSEYTLEGGTLTLPIDDEFGTEITLIFIKVK